jgi:hypothetical protein
VEEWDPYDGQRIQREAELVRDLYDLGAVPIRRPRKTMGFEKRMERADENARTGVGSYIGDPTGGYWLEDRKRR